LDIKNHAITEIAAVRTTCVAANQMVVAKLAVSAHVLPFYSSTPQLQESSGALLVSRYSVFTICYSIYGFGRGRKKEWDQNYARGVVKFLGMVKFQ